MVTSVATWCFLLRQEVPCDEVKEESPSPKYTSTPHTPEPGATALFGKRVFEMGLGWALNPMPGVLIRKGDIPPPLSLSHTHTHTHTHTEER